jgi:putative heme-binding domain-containing protein
VGPELTGYDRKNLSFLLPAIIDPSLALREEYELVTLQLRPAPLDDEGPILSGFVTHLADQTLTLKDLGGNETVIRLADIASREHSSTSIMPEGLLDGLSKQQVADLMAYIQAD